MLRKIAESVPVCRDRQHDPPTHMVLLPGTYEHECPSCKRVLTFTVPEIQC